MGYPLYTKSLEPGTYQITAASRIVKISIIGRSATPSTYEGNSDIAPPGGFPTGGPIDIENNERVVDTGTNSGFIQKATLIVPENGAVDVFIEHNPR